MPSRASTSFLLIYGLAYYSYDVKVSMPSRASTSFLRSKHGAAGRVYYEMCQCPHGLVPHFYEDYAVAADLDKFKCQCPHGLVPHFYRANGRKIDVIDIDRVNALTG